MNINPILRGKHYHFSRFMQDHPISYLILVLLGIYFIYGAIKKPKFFWDSKGAIRIRDIFGNKNAIYVYIVLGFFLVILGIVLI